MSSESDRFLTGVPGLDAILGGGVFEGGIYIVQGAPGAGKTILGNQICFNAVARGGRALYVTLLAESHSRMLQHLRGLSFFDEDVILDRLSYVSAFHALEADGLKGLMDLLRREMRSRGACWKPTVISTTWASNRYSGQGPSLRCQPTRRSWPIARSKGGTRATSSTTITIA